MNILVTGSTGFVGSHLCRALLALGHSVRAFHRESSQLRLLEGLDVEHAVGDLTQPETIQAAVEDIEMVFHAAAWMGGHEQPGRTYTVTVEGTRSLLMAARRAGVRRVIHTSSAAALGIPDAAAQNRPRGKQEKNTPPMQLMNENHTWNYRPDYYPYGYAKYLAEQEAQKAVSLGLDVVIVNPTLVFGAGDIYRQAGSLVTQVAERRISVAIEGGINCVHIADVVEGHLAAMEFGKTGERYLLGGENLTHLQLLQLIARVTGTSEPNLVLPTRLVRAMAGPTRLFQQFLSLPVSPDLLRLAGYYFFYDLHKSESCLGLKERRPIQDAIAEAYTWFSQSK